jgi:sterol 3beta-glucosyltransferase
VRVYIATVGSRGDFEPFRALAMEASSAGHEVHFAHTADFSADEKAPYTSHTLPGSFEAFLVDGFSLVKSLASYRSVIKPMLEGIYGTSTKQIVELEPDVVVYHPKVITAATAAHSIGALAVIVEMFPTLTPTREFPAAGLTVSLPGWLNRASYRLVSAGLTAFGNPGKSLANTLGVSRYQPDVTVCPVSPVIVPRPLDWPETASITGHWFLPQPPDEDAELDAFLSAGPTVYVGFGSMNDGEQHARARARAIVSAARLLGFQTLLATGWGGLQPDSDLAGATDVLIRQSVHHDSVFPRVAAAIHHGGAGTTHQALRSGTPSVIMPFLADQPWWAARLALAGLGPEALPKRTVSVTRIRRALGEAVGRREAVRAVAEEMAAENGVAVGRQFIEEAWLAHQSDNSL